MHQRWTITSGRKCVPAYYRVHNSKAGYFDRTVAMCARNPALRVFSVSLFLTPVARFLCTEFAKPFCERTTNLIIRTEALQGSTGIPTNNDSLETDGGNLRGGVEFERSGKPWIHFEGASAAPRQWIRRWFLCACTELGKVYCGQMRGMWPFPWTRGHTWVREHGMDVFSQTVSVWPVGPVVPEYLQQVQ